MTAEVCALFSGGKDSSYALARADDEYGVGTVATVRARDASMMYHVPAVEAAERVAEARASDHLSVSEGDDETEPLREVAERSGADVFVVGAVASEYQKQRVDTVADEFGAEVYAPLWDAEPLEALDRIVGEFEVIVTGIAADGMGADWLGRELDADAVDELAALADEYGVHPMGEGGEYETLAVAGPHFDGRLKVEYEKDWDGVRGSLRLTDVSLVPR